MKAFGSLLCLLLLIGNSNPGINADRTWIVQNRDLKELVDDPSSLDEDGASGGNEHLEDYGPFDPVPSSKASIRPGPIQHGTPAMPYIPKASPPPGTLPKRGA